jgi:hypothetical protein
VPPQDGKLAFGVKFTADGRHLAVAVAMKPAGAPVHVELIFYRSTSKGYTWLAEWLAERWRKVSIIVLDGMSGAETLKTKLEGMRVPAKVINKAKTNEMIAAATMFLNAVRAGKEDRAEVTHFGQPALTISALHARKRPVGKGGGWGFGDGVDAKTGVAVDSAPVEAAALADWGVMTSKRNPGRRQRMI